MSVDAAGSFQHRTSYAIITQAKTNEKNGQIPGPEASTLGAKRVRFLLEIPTS